MPATTYAFRNGQFVDKRTGKPMHKPFAGQIVAPIIMPDTPEHMAPDGTLITSRSHRDELCKRNDWVPYEKINSRPRGYANKKFAEKRGLQVSEASQEWLKNKHTEQAKKAGLV